MMVYYHSVRKYSLSKSEKLKSRTIIADLFRGGRSVFVYPLKLIFLPIDDQQFKHPVQVAFTVPKRQYRKATDRNLIKRHLREQYRLAKPSLYQSLHQAGISVALIYIYVGKKASDTDLVIGSMERINKKLLKSIK